MFDTRRQIARVVAVDGIQGNRAKRRGDQETAAEERMQTRTEYRDGRADTLDQKRYDRRLAARQAQRDEKIQDEDRQWKRVDAIAAGKQRQETARTVSRGVFAVGFALIAALLLIGIFAEELGKMSKGYWNIYHRYVIGQSADMFAANPTHVAEVDTSLGLVGACDTRLEALRQATVKFEETLNEICRGNLQNRAGSGDDKMRVRWLEVCDSPPPDLMPALLAIGVKSDGREKMAETVYRLQQDLLQKSKVREDISGLLARCQQLDIKPLEQRLQLAQRVRQDLEALPASSLTPHHVRESVNDFLAKQQRDTDRAATDNAVKVCLAKVVPTLGDFSYHLGHLRMSDAPHWYGSADQLHAYLQQVGDPSIDSLSDERIDSLHSTARWAASYATHYFRDQQPPPGWKVPTKPAESIQALFDTYPKLC